ncbi:MAG: carboxypeptidase M32 [Pseudomonadota bacterium]
MTAYEELTKRAARMSSIGNALGILGWDNETLMPKGGAETRAEALATLAVLRHDMVCDPALADLLDGAAAQEDLNEWQRANIREFRRNWVSETAVSADLVEASTKAIARCELRWRQAREDSDFAGLNASLDEVLRLQTEIGAAKGERLGLSTYDALLDQFEPGMTADGISTLFDDLAGFLPDFIEAVLERQASRPTPVEPEGPFPILIQKQLASQLMATVGFDFERGRLDESTHPFCGGADNDVRITTRYDENRFASALLGVLHETGHALYEQGRPVKWMNQPVGQSRGLGFHESQSLIIEMQAVRSREFLSYAAPVLRQAFGADGKAWNADNLYRLFTKVDRSLIRVDADEVTYPAHIILRFRLEQAMIAGDLTLSELPGAWADGMSELVGVVPENDRLGCLQDIHWPGGAWGYFPTYTIGAMTAAQLFDAAKKANPGLMDCLAKGDFEPLVDWLRAAIHSQGCLYEAEELLIRATGGPLDAAIFKAHLKRRYLGED